MLSSRYHFLDEVTVSMRARMYALMRMNYDHVTREMF